MKFKTLGIIAVASLAALSLAACGAAPGGNSAASKGTEIGKTFKLGYDLELSGGVAAYGNAGKNGANLAVDEINKAGGINGKQITVISKDNKSDNAEAATVVSNLINNDKVNAVIGSMTSGAVKSMTPNVTKGAVPLVTPAGTDDTLTVTNGKVNDYIFRSTFQDSYQGKVLANYTTNELKAKKVVLYYDNSSDYAKGIAKSFEKTYTGKIVDKVSFQSGDKDFQATLSKIKSEDYDAIVMPGYYNETGLITKQARELGIEQPILGGDGFADPTFITLAGDAAATNVYYVSGYSAKALANETTTKFIAAYQAKYKSEPSMFDALAYDAVYMVKQAAEDTKAKTSVDVKDGLAKLKGFKGATGDITVDKDHNPVKDAVVVKLENGKEASATLVKPD
ncbi:MAG: ABC transporter substrate-binding protein [Lactococcus raffinolactis]|jgi:branched-chain amino acid transport system substrate-binding protein|uniref:ABC transporter substrate-binding protein n=1 Tax=Pseudolactococcus raffinolactis TaxID=1366 RepID=A0A2A5SBG0_9LACT|nr:ABC transporter substrate-binding protein [Lactococcus raffinolactis]MBR2542171.1 ABC transporter substrate-binding protein [Lactococcus sp.]ATC61248.1 branched-chain amino acid ABC transporter substrate-binding protein [Lactococcus raffinolactis]MBW9298167.1 ABC transporter substrate-binding protein [Lactococcus raffinolactis]MBW9330800.1 ABC transporter substrate-binding protein [Lactococcus raffinolactis]MCH4163069.1 ABC transporter substrate-binding protein [Lactococcus raffinolactis]